MQPHDTPIKGSGSVLRTCERCGDAFLANLARIAMGRARFCSNQCRPTPNQGKGRTLIDRTCATCGTSFTASPYRVAQGKARFCSRRCNTSRRPPGPLYTRICQQCAVVFTLRASRVNAGYDRYCSQACAGLAKRGKPRDAGVTLSVRFAMKTDTNGMAPEFHPEFGVCWDWIGSLLKSGYGSIGTDNHRTTSAHRVAWELATGERLTRTDVIGHTCDVRRCVRNDEIGTYRVRDRTLPRRGHLFKGTHQDNTHDMIDKGRAGGICWTPRKTDS